jgi:hypothetical protein
MCIPSTNFKWFQVTMTSELLRQGLENGQLSQPWQCNYHAKIDLFFVCSHTKPFQCVLIKGLQHFSQDQDVINGFKTSQTLAQPCKYLPSLEKKKKRQRTRRKRKEWIRKIREISIRNISVEVHEPKQKDFLALQIYETKISKRKQRKSSFYMYTFLIQKEVFSDLLLLFFIIIFCFIFMFISI